jgi:hypothetical protein
VKASKYQSEQRFVRSEQAANFIQNLENVAPEVSAHWLYRSDVLKYFIIRYSVFTSCFSHAT